MIPYAVKNCKSVTVVFVKIMSEYVDWLLQDDNLVIFCVGSFEN